MEELHANRRHCYEYRDSSILVFTETWLRKDIPDSLVELEGFSCVRADRTDSSMKSRGGGICVYVSNIWCQQYTIRETLCCPNLELLCLSMRPFYLPREFGNIILCATYIPPGGNAKTAANQVAEVVHNQLQRTPNAPIFILGDFNQCKLEWALPGFYQYVKCGTRKDKVLDKCYGNIKDAYKAMTLPPLSNSDHSTVFFMPTYKTALKSSKPQHKTVLQWTEDSVETLRGCLACTDWNIFHNLELDEATVTITDYINFCVDNVVPKKDVLHFPNNKPYITKDVKVWINKKKLAFKCKDRAGVATAQKELNLLLKNSREQYRSTIDQSFGSGDNRKLWDCMKNITNMNTQRKQITSLDDKAKANELNDFFLRFETDDFSNEGAHALETISARDFTDKPKRLEIEPRQVCNIFSKVCAKKSKGPDGLPAFLLKKCPFELSVAWCPIFQKSLDRCTVPALWKRSIIIPVPKISCPSTDNDFRPIALTSVVMKCFEKLVVNLLKAEVSVDIDPLQFAYRQGRGTEDAVTSVTHLISKHLEDTKAYARVLFIDFSSAFNTIQPHLLVQKLANMGVNPHIIKWFYSFLTHRSQQVMVNNSLSELKQCSTGVPQGCVSSPMLFTLYTDDCRTTNPKNYIIKFSDDTIILSLLQRDDCPSPYHDEISSFKSWCDSHHLILNTNKTKEMIFDPRGVRQHDAVSFNNCVIQQVSSYKYLGVLIDDQLKWREHVEFLCGKLAQRIHFLRRLRLFGVEEKNMMLFYNAVLESIIRYSMTAWFGNLTVQSKTKIANLVKTAMKIIGHKGQPSLQSIYDGIALKMVHKILNDPTHLLHHEYELLPSGKRYRASRYKSNRFKLSFVPSSITLLNKQPQL